jgi:hypothetical protein
VVNYCHGKDFQVSLLLDFPQLGRLARSRNQHSHRRLHKSNSRLRSLAKEGVLRLQIFKNENGESTVTMINQHNPGTPLYSDCVICGGKATLMSSANASVTLDGTVYKVHFHKACLDENTRPKVMEALQKLINP